MCVVSLAMVAAVQAQPKPFGKVQRIVFLGNSITYSGGYVTDLEAWFVARYPKKSYEFINMGLPSETVSGLSEEGHADGKFPRPVLQERLDRVLAITKPGMVFICYGMNDGIYLPFDSARFQKFKEGLQEVHDRIAKTGAKIIHITPPDYDDATGPVKGYEATLDRYANWVFRQKDSGWNVVDIHYAMKNYTAMQRKKDSSFTLAKDGVHPGGLGHWIIARELLLYLGENGVMNAADIHAALGKIKNGEAILNLVAQRQQIMKDAWLTAAGHKRPGMNKGLPLVEAEIKYSELEKQVRALVK